MKKCNNLKIYISRFNDSYLNLIILPFYSSNILKITNSFMDLASKSLWNLPTKLNYLHLKIFLQRTSVMHLFILIFLVKFLILVKLRDSCSTVFISSGIKSKLSMEFYIFHRFLVGLILSFLQLVLYIFNFFFSLWFLWNFFVS